MPPAAVGPNETRLFPVPRDSGAEERHFPLGAGPLELAHEAMRLVWVVAFAPPADPAVDSPISAANPPPSGKRPRTSARPDPGGMAGPPGSQAPPFCTKIPA